MTKEKIKKEKVTYSLKKSTIAKAEVLAKELNKSKSAIIDIAIENYSNDEKTLAQEIVEELNKEWYSVSRGLLLSSRQSEKNTFMLIELLHSFIRNVLPIEKEEYFSTYRYENLIDKQNGTEQIRNYDRESKISNIYLASTTQTEKYYTAVKKHNNNKK